MKLNLLIGEMWYNLYYQGYYEIDFAMMILEKDFLRRAHLRLLYVIFDIIHNNFEVS